jgi:zinc transport system substrate-binding protein
MSVSCYRKQVSNIAKGLIETNPANSLKYERNLAEYDNKLEKLEEQQQEVKKLFREKSAILLHPAFAYVAKDLCIEVEYSMDFDAEGQVSAGEVATLITLIQSEEIPFIFAEELYGKDMCDTIQREVDVTVIYLDPLNRGEYEADSYIEAMSRNMKHLLDAFTE